MRELGITTPEIIVEVIKVRELMVAYSSVGLRQACREQSPTGNCALTACGIEVFNSIQPDNRINRLAFKMVPQCSNDICLTITDESMQHRVHEEATAFALTTIGVPVSINPR